MHVDGSLPVPVRARDASGLLALDVNVFAGDATHVAMPRAEVQLVVRFGPTARDGLDVHARGGSERAHRKFIRAGQRAVSARLRLGTYEAVLGASAPSLVGRIVPLDALWGDAEAERLRDRLAASPDDRAAARLVEEAIAARIAASTRRPPHARLVLGAIDRLATTSVSAVADQLGVSERTLRRAFHDVVGMGPKSYAKVARFHRALRAARLAASPSWAAIASTSGYYDQAHLIAEFREITGVTPRALIDELRATSATVGTRARV